MAAISGFWQSWIARYTADGGYWYVPKGKSIGDLGTIQSQLRLLKPFEGRPWRETQRPYLARLAQSGLTSATAQDDDLKGIPMSRMLAQVFGTLGLAWIDEAEAVTLTEAGEAFIVASNPAPIAARQAMRYQIANPMAGGKATRRIEVRPVPYLLEVLLKTKTLTRTEYILFCAKAQGFGDIDDSIDGVESWRALGPRQRDRILGALDAVAIDAGSGGRRSSIYNTIRLDASYALAFWTASGVLRQTATGGEVELSIPRARLPEANRIVRASQTNGQFIPFETKKDWMAFYGDPARQLDRATALSYFTDTERLDLVRRVLDEMPGYSEADKRAYLSMMVSEKTVEDILEHNLELIEPGMTLVSRQLATEVGRIDLFARDRNGTYTIIELKKGKTDDDVFGQLSRYLGWCRKTKARSGAVRGIIIARRIGPKLWAAADGHDTAVELLEYDLRMSLAKATRGSTPAPG